MEFKYLDISALEGILTITINRPEKMNALNLDVIDEISRAIKQAEADDEVKGIIITGSGPKAFVAGADISEFSNFTPGEAREMAEAGHGAFNSVENCDKPVIAAINGFALGGGCELAMSCHMRIAASNAKFGQPEINLGIIPGYGGTQRLVRYIGKGKATELLLTGDMISADEAKALGLVNYVVPQEELIDKSREVLGKIITKSPLAIAQVLRLVNTYYEKNEDGFHEEMEEFSDCFETADQKEGMAAFLEKRKPVFTGK